ncbi:MAG: hypothetical protein U1E83_11015 [Methylotetracoccus sp.]
MNPFLFKSHPMLLAAIGLLTGSGRYGAADAAILLLVIAAITVPFAECVVLVAKRAAGIAVRFRVAWVLAFPAAVVYMPIVLTVLNDIVGHTFAWQDRYIFLFALAVAVIMLAALYGVVVHYRGGQPVGSEIGLTLALALLLAAIPCGLIVLALDGWLGFFPPPRAIE